MSKHHIRIGCIAAILSLFVLPVVGRWMAGVNPLPPDFLRMPFPKGPDKPGFNIVAFILVLIPCLIILALGVFPKWFGFKRQEQDTPQAGLPWWFWAGAGTALIAWIIMRGQFAWLGKLEYFTFVPLWWGVIFTLDGVVYQKTGGVSLAASRPRTLLAIAFASWAGWYLFQYLDYFLLKDWYFPDDGLLSPLEYHLWIHLGNTTVWPAVFEWYCLLSTSQTLQTRYAHGPKVDLSRFGWGFLLAGGGMTIALSIWPIPLFWSVWIGPPFILGGVLLLAGRWTPVSPMKKGNWTSMVLLGLAGLCNGLLWELLNYHSNPTNPSFWKYDIPYFQGMEKIGEMPIIGFAGYIPFGIFCMVWWLVLASIFGFSRYIVPELEQSAQ